MGGARAHRIPAHRRRRATDIPHAWFFPAADGQADGGGNQDLLHHPTDNGAFPATREGTVGTPDARGVYPAMLEFGAVSDLVVDHYTIVYAGHTDTLEPVPAGGYRFVAYAVSRTDQPQAIIAYDASGHEIGRETGSFVEFFTPKN